MNQLIPYMIMLPIFYEDLTYTSFEPSPTNNNIDYFIDMLKDGYYCVINKKAFSI